MNVLAIPGNATEFNNGRHSNPILIPFGLFLMIEVA